MCVGFTHKRGTTHMSMSELLEQDYNLTNRFLHDNRQTIPKNKFYTLRHAWWTFLKDTQISKQQKILIGI